MRRQIAGWMLALIGGAVITRGLTSLRDALALSSVILIYLVFVVVVATVGGALPGIATAFVTSLLLNFYFTPPIHTWTIANPENVLALFVFLAVAGTVAWLVTTATRRAIESRRARAQAEVLVRVAGTMADSREPVTDLLDFLRTTFELESAAVLRRASSGWRVEAHAGTPCPVKPEDGSLSVELPPGNAMLVLVGPTLRAEDRWVLRAFAAQLSAGLLERRLRSQASDAERLGAANELRTALLASVSHDLRSPLSSIKASASSLLQKDITWSPDETQEFLQTIDEEADRLNKLVGNLLDMSRLHAGRLNLAMSDVGVEEIVAVALTALGERGRTVLVDVPEDLPRVRADPGLLERAVSSLVDNALKYGPGSSIRVEAGSVGNAVLVRVIDQGPGIPSDNREHAFTPFQRLGDGQDGSGVGLGMAIARGFVEAMGGQLTLEDTPGGGLTVVIELEVSR